METAQISSIVATVITAILTYLNWRTTNRKSETENQVTLGGGWEKLVNELQEEVRELRKDSDAWKIERQGMIAQMKENQREIDELNSVLSIVRDRVTVLEAEKEQLRQENQRLKLSRGRL